MSTHSKDLDIGEGTAKPVIKRISLDPRRNTLRLVLDERPVAERQPGEATIDIGENGRLLGVELGGDAGSHGTPLYLTLVASTDVHVRSITATVQEDRDDCGRLLAVEIPRRGKGYEIAYPSGNQ